MFDLSLSWNYLICYQVLSLVFVNHHREHSQFSNSSFVSVFILFICLNFQKLKELTISSVPQGGLCSNSCFVRPLGEENMHKMFSVAEHSIAVLRCIEDYPDNQ